MTRLPREFYTRKDVFRISRELLGKFLVTCLDGVVTSGMITEVEAYAGVDDSASHAFNGRRTRRTEVMYAVGGTAYVYLCYGIHHLFNVITNVQDVPHAVLIRGMEPVEGLVVMKERRKLDRMDYALTAGPGSLSQALGIRVQHNGMDLLEGSIWIEDRGLRISGKNILATVRVGVEHAGRDARLPYRYIIRDNPWVSRTPK